MQLIKEYGLAFGDQNRSNVEAYIIVLAKVNLERGLCDVEIRRLRRIEQREEF